jgi:hypothetical protein
VGCRDLRPYGATAQSRATRILKSCSDLARLRSALWTGQSTCDGPLRWSSLCSVSSEPTVSPPRGRRWSRWQELNLQGVSAPDSKSGPLPSYGPTPRLKWSGRQDLNLRFSSFRKKREQPDFPTSRLKLGCPLGFEPRLTDSQTGVLTVNTMDTLKLYLPLGGGML